MSDEGKGANKVDRKRLVYLKARLKELKDEMQTLKKESGDLREKLGKQKKGGAEGEAKKAGRKKKALASHDE